MSRIRTSVAFCTPAQSRSVLFGHWNYEDRRLRRRSSNAFDQSMTT